MSVRDQCGRVSAVAASVDYQRKIAGASATAIRELAGRRVLKRETVDLMMQNHIPVSALPIFPGSPEPPGRNGFGYGGGVRMDADPAMPGSVGTFRWSGYATTFFWIDRKTDLIAMLWTQYIPEPEVWAVDGQFQKLVYAAVK